MVIESIPKIIGMVYAIAASLIVVFLLLRGRLSKRTGRLLLVISAAFGFLVFAPMLPNQFQSLLLGNTGQLMVPAAFAALVLALFLVLAFVFGRAFCGYACPIGAMQELAHQLPVKKLKLKSNAIPTAFRFGSLAAFVILALALSIGSLKYLGVREFFYLNPASAFFYVFLSLLAMSAFVYRPFCSFFCPYGVLQSLVATRSRFRFRRSEACLDCGKCEGVCPTSAAGKTGLKWECYLCGKCKEACPVDAIEYTRKPKSVEDGQQEEEMPNVAQPARVGARKGSSS